MYTKHLGAASSESDYVDILFAVSFSRTRTSSYFRVLQPQRKVGLYLCVKILYHSYASYLFSLVTYKKCKVYFFSTMHLLIMTVIKVKFKQACLIILEI